MKSFSDDALHALERGDAIVSASVEIIPQSAVFVTGTTAAISCYTGAPYPGADVKVGLSFHDATGTQIGSTHYSFLGTPTVWVTQSSSATTPADAARIRIHIYFANAAGPDNTSCVDDITLTVNGVAQTLFNPGAESGMSGWTVSHGTVSAVTSRGTLSPHSGTMMFTGRDGAASDHDEAYHDFYADVGGDATIAAPAIRLWGGYGDAELPSDEGTSTFHGIGDRGLIQSSSGAIGGSAQNTTLALSGIEAAALEVLNPEEVRNASVVVRRLIFDSSGKTLLGAYVYSRGRLDELKTVEMVGGAAAIQLSVEGAARGLGRRGGRRRSDADQRLVSSTDGFYRVVSAAPKKTLYWGGKLPSVGSSALSGSSGSSTGSTTASF